jgi:hypothetical protein
MMIIFYFSSFIFEFEVSVDFERFFSDGFSAVRKIIDDLSDGVSQLVLLVVVLQEKNAEVPPQLPEAASVVNKTAKTLATIAKQLAETNYKEHPSIKQEIIDAAVTVENATVTLDNAVRILQTSSNREV